MNNQIIRVSGITPTYFDRISENNMYSGYNHISFYNTGVISNPKVFTGNMNTSSGVANFNISSAGFSNIYSINCTIVSNSPTVNQRVWCIVNSFSLTNVTVTTYTLNSTGVVVLGVTVVGSINTTVFTGVKNIMITVIGN